jgi:N-acetylglucosaminyldiphosphoundecaprenol N-acetyl-beta-D-mannosaminyltransferase
MLDLRIGSSDHCAQLNPSHAGASHDVLGIGFNLISYEDVMTTIIDWRERGLHHYITLTPPHSVLMCLRDAALRRATDGAALTLPDGVGDILAAKLLGYPHHGRVTGPTLMLRLCDWGRAYGIRHFFHGGLPGVTETLCDRLTRRFPGLIIAGTCCPPFSTLTATKDAKIVDRINRCRPDIVWVGLGSPKQEKWMAEHLGRIQAAALIGVGAAFDFHSGRVKWAPEWVRKIGLEWAYRLMREPKRMCRRNANSVVFLARVLFQRLQANNHPQTNSIPSS